MWLFVENVIHTVEWQCRFYGNNKKRRGSVSIPAPFFVCTWPNLQNCRNFEGFKFVRLDIKQKIITKIKTENCAKKPKNNNLQWIY